MMSSVKISMNAYKTRIIAALMQPAQTSLVRLIASVKTDFLGMELPVQVRQFSLLAYSVMDYLAYVR